MTVLMVTLGHVVPDGSFLGVQGWQIECWIVQAHCSCGVWITFMHQAPWSQYHLKKLFWQDAFTKRAGFCAKILTFRLRLMVADESGHHTRPNGNIGGKQATTWVSNNMPTSWISSVRAARQRGFTGNNGSIIWPEKVGSRTSYPSKFLYEDRKALKIS